MASPTYNPVRPHTATYNSQALYGLTDFRATINAGSVVQFADEVGEQIIAVKSFDYIANFTINTEDPAGAGGIDMNNGSILFDANASLVVTFYDMKRGNTITATGAASTITGAEYGASRSAPGSATITGVTLFGASGDNPYAWAQSA